MSARLEFYVRRVDGTSYCEAAGRNDAKTRREFDRAAWKALARADVVGVEVQVREGRAAGYERSR